MTDTHSRGRYIMTAPDDVNPGDVIALPGSGAWRFVTDTHEPRHALAGTYGAVILETVSYVTGEPTGPLTVFPRESVAVVPGSWLPSDHRAPGVYVFAVGVES